MTAPPVSEESKTIGGLAVWARKVLEAAGVDHAAQESQWLVRHVLGLQGHQLVSEGERTILPEERRSVESLISRRAAREPLQYLLGTQEFCGLEFDVNRAVLIPRPETELLVQEAVRQAGLGPGSLIVDVGTGSGCVAVTLATIFTDARILAVDQSPAALAMARANAAKHGVAGKIEWLEGDLLQPLRDRETPGSVTIIVSNPPYIAEVDWDGLQPEVRLFEPRMALVGGSHGTEIHERLLQESREWLAHGGTAIMEIGAGQVPALHATAERVGGYAALRVVRDAADIERVVIAQRVG